MGLRQTTRGVTIVELVVVVLLIAVLAAIIFIALNPVQRLAQSRNSQRASDVTAILEAIHRYTLDSQGQLPSGLSSGMLVTQIGTQDSDCDVTCGVASASACVNLNSSLAKYLKQMPVDPSIGSQLKTGYFVTVTENNEIVVGVCSPEGDDSIAVSK